MAEIISIRGMGNGAREALIEVALDLPNTSDEDAAVWTDWILAELWMRGFKVVPLEPKDEHPRG